MAESKRPNCRTKGAILIMVLTIMFVLIIMLVATLSVVSTAKRRTYTSFEENQASFTSRSAIEFFIKDLCANKTDDSDHVDPYYKGSSTKMKYGREIEMDIRLLKSQDKDTTIGLSDALLLAKGLDPVNFSYDDNDTKALYQMYEAPTGGATPVAPVKMASGYDTYNNGVGAGTTANPAILKYEVTLPKAEAGSNKYGKFADSDEKVIITVEVLDRYFHKGADPINTSNPPSVIYGDRRKDVMKLRVTSTAVFDDYEATTVIIVNTSDPVETNDFTKGVVSTGPIECTTKIYALGGLTANADYKFTNDSIYDSLYVNGDLEIGSSGDLNLGPDCYIVATGDIDYKASQALYSQTNKSFIYAGGKFKMGVSGTIGYDGSLPAAPTPVPLDIICNGGEITSSAKIYGDIYCEGDLILDQSKIVGDIYVDGDFDPGTSTINGDVHVNGNLFLSGNKVNGDGSYSAGNTITPASERINGNIYGNTANIFWGTMGSGTTTNVTGVAAIPYSTALDLKYFVPGTKEPDLNASPVRTTSQYKTTTSTNKTVNDVNSKTITLSLPGYQYGSTTDQKKYELPSFEYEYPVYLSVTENPAAGATQTGYKLNGYIKAVDKYRSDIKDTTATLNSFTTPATFSGGKITGSGYLSSGNYNNVIISSGVTLQLLDGATYTGNMIAEDDTSDINILVPDGANVTIAGGFYSKELAQILKIGPYSATYKSNTIYAGGQTTANLSKLCASPRINMYVGDSAEITLDTLGGVYPMLNAYVYGPNASLFNTTNGVSCNMNYNAQPITHGCTAVGALVFSYIKNGESAIVFIPQGTLSSPIHGHPLLTWKSGRYTNDVEAK